MKALFALLLVPVAAHAWQFEAGVGANRYTTRGDGTWYQTGSPGNSVKLDFPAFKAGVSVGLYEGQRFGLRAHVDYVNLGHLASRCQCTEDANYNMKTHTVVDSSVPTANLSGSGGAQGIALTLEPYLVYRDWQIGIEGGLFPYRPSWSVSALWHLDGSTHTYDTPHSVQWGKVVGVNVSYKNFGVSLQHYWLPTRYSDQNAPAMFSGANVLMLTYRF